ncbi:hypothetical protein ACOMHN_008773 [Nucella lapillus]
MMCSSCTCQCVVDDDDDDDYDDDDDDDYDAYDDADNDENDDDDDDDDGDADNVNGNYNADDDDHSDDDHDKDNSDDDDDVISVSEPRAGRFGGGCEVEGSSSGEKYTSLFPVTDVEYIYRGVSRQSAAAIGFIQGRYCRLYVNRAGSSSKAFLQTLSKKRAVQEEG